MSTERRLTWSGKLGNPLMIETIVLSEWLDNGTYELRYFLSMGETGFCKTLTMGINNRDQFRKKMAGNRHRLSVTP